MSILYDMRSGELVKSKLYTNNLLLKDSLGFNPLSLFKDGKQGVWYDPSDKSTLFQDVAGTVPVTKDGDPVALMRDKSGNGNHAMQSVSAARPVYKTDGILHWLAFDGADDYLQSMFEINPVSVLCGVKHNKRSSSVAIGYTKWAYWYNHSAFSNLIFNNSLEVTSGNLHPTSMLDVFVGSTEVVSGGNSKVYINNKLGVTQSAYSIKPTSTTGVVLGARSNGVGADSWFLNGSLYGVIIVDSVLTNDEREIATHYLANKSGVTL